MTSEWKATVIGNLCGQVFSGGTPASKNAAYFEGGTIPWLKTKEVNYCRIRKSENFITELGLRNSSAKLVPVNSVIVAMYGNGDTAGRVAINKIPLTTNQACCNLVVNSEKADYRFVYYFLSAQYQKLVDLKNGGAQQNLNAGLIKNFPISIPALFLQHQVSDFLEALDDRIELLRETNATLEAIAQALFKSWFVDFDPVRAKAEGRGPEGFDVETAGLFPDSFEESELGIMPKGWRWATVGQEVVTVDYVANGSFATLKENVTLLYEPAYALYLRTTDYNSGFSGDFRYVDKAAYDFLSKSSLTSSDIVISNVGDVGTVFRPPAWLGFPMTLGSNAVALKNQKMTSYLFHYFKGDKGQHALRSIVTGSAQLKFNKTNLRSLKLQIPPDNVLSKFELVTGSLLEKVDANCAQIRTLASLRNTLLPRLISGQLRLPEAEALLRDAA